MLMKIIALILLTLTQSINGRCGFNKLQERLKREGNDRIGYHREPAQEVRTDGGKLTNKQSYDYIRISVNYDNIDKDTTVDKTFTDNIKAFTNNAANLFTKILKVIPLKNVLKVNEEECKRPLNTVTVNDQLKNEGLNVDLILLVTFDTNSKPGDTTEAWATNCMSEETTKRPVVGVVGLPKSALKFTKTNWLEHYTYLILHEIFHVLAFNNAFYEQYWNPASSSTRPISEVILDSYKVNGVNRKLLITPKVIQAAKKHFNCDNIKGVELENQGGDGSMGAHWEARIMLGDFMIAESFEENFISEISCALAEDTGWYQVDCYSGGLFKYGKNEGCAFLNDSCVQDGKPKFREFCQTNDQSLCMTSLKSHGLCKITSDDKLSAYPSFQYFTDKTLGGYQWADFCPLVQGIDSEKTMFASNCIYGDANTDVKYQTIGKGSGCFMSNLSKDDPLDKKLATCYQYICDKDTTSVKVKISADAVVQCPGAGGSLKINGFKGEIQCPDYNVICNASVVCDNIADCINKKSIRVDPIDIQSSDNTTVVIYTDQSAKILEVSSAFTVAFLQKNSRLRNKLNRKMKN